tara:strand:- start:72 stop:218 length:147 start_codon:yes stop_codon:yes gene_type:complete
MARKKKPLFGVNTYIKKKPRKRPGRHSKNPNKGSKRKRYRRQGRKRIL